MTDEKVYETQYVQDQPSNKARERYTRVHSVESQLRKVSSSKQRTDRHRQTYRKSYSNYFIRLPKQWSDGLQLEKHDRFLWNIISYDPVVLQLRKLEAGDSL